jgi:gliding motility-associated-like protein
MPALLLFAATQSKGQNCGLEDNLPINFNSLHSYEIEITDVFNDDLSAPDQGLCGVEIRFIHSFVENLELWLESPSGQMIQLIGPNTDDQISTTFFALWDISFVSCIETAEPDLGYEPIWNNDQANNWVNGGQYNGSYYPALGCLEDFNTGPANGTWTINIANDPSNYEGAILDFRLVFCDNRGQECCFADAGNVPDTLDVLTCIGDPSLVFDFDPVYDNQNDIPDTVDYGYTYAIMEDSILIEFDSTLDLTGYAVGTYQLCGISYDREDSTSFPMPDGIINIDSIRNNLNGFEPYFCGRITDSCIIVEILPQPETTFLTDTICAGDSLMLGDSTFTETGMYAVTLPSFAECDSIVNLDLTVLEIPITNLVETICEGDTLWVGTMPYTQTGIYADTLNNFFGCDSIVNLDLTVLEPILLTLNETICEGDSYMVGDSTFTETGSYQVDLLSAQNCDSIVTLNLNVIDPLAQISGPDTVDCYTPEIILSSALSTPAGQLDFAWTNLAGDDLGSDPTLSVTTGGTYILWVSQTDNGTLCQSSDTLVVVEDLDDPVADAGNMQTLTCAVQELTLGGPNTTQNNDVVYLWEAMPGNIVGSNSVIDPMVDAPGNYTLTVTDTTNGCAVSAMVVINIDTIPPVADAGPDQDLDCDNPTLILDGTNSSIGAAFAYDWISVTGVVPTNFDTPSPTVSVPDEYQLIVSNTINGCADTAFVMIGIDTVAPTVLLAEPDTLDCVVESLELDGTGSDMGANFDFYWNILDGGNISANPNSYMPTVDAIGTYELVVVNTDNGCRDSALIAVTDTLTTIVANPGTADTLTCEMQEVELNAAASTGSNDLIYCWTTTDGQIVGDSNQVNIMVDEPGIYQLLVKDTITQCSAMSTIEVFQDENFPIAEAGAQVVLNCRDTLLNLDGTASTGGTTLEFSWSGPCIESGAETPTPEVSCAGWYFLSLTNPENGCTTIDSVEVLLNETTPIADAGVMDTLTCRDSVLVLDASLSSGDDLSFSWTGPGIIDNVNTANPSINQAGVYQVIVSNTLSFCSDTAMVEIVVDTLAPVIDLLPSDSITCLDSILTLGGPNTSSGPEFSYSWITSEGSIIGADDGPSVLVDSAGVYVFFVTNTLNGCESTGFSTIVADTLAPFSSAGPDRELTCGSDQVLLNGTNSADGSFISYLWEGPCIESDPTVDSLFAGCEGIYTLTVSNTQNGCAATDEVEITLNEQAPVAVLPDTAFISCETGDTQLDATGSINGNLIWLYEDMATTLTGIMPTITETGIYTLIVNNPGLGCADTTSVLVLLDCQPLISVATPDTLTCSASTVMLDASASSSGPQYVFEWTADDPTCIVDGADTPTPTVRCAGDYTLILTNEAVDLSDTLVVTVEASDELPTADAGMPDTLDCIQLLATLDGSASTGNNPLDYLWTNLSGDTIAMTAMAQVAVPDVYLLEVTDLLTGCTDVDPVVISGNTAVPDISFGSNIVPCEADTIDIDAQVNPTGNYSYQWTGSGIISDPTALQIQVDSADWYFLNILNEGNGCTTQDSIQIIRQSCGPCVEIVMPDSITCDRQTVVLQGNICEICVGCDTFWTTADGVIDSQDGLTATVSAAGIYVLTVTDMEGFSTEIEVEVTENQVDPTADAGPGLNLTCQDTILRLGGPNTTQGVGIEYEWTSSNGTFMSPTDQDTVLAIGEGLYYLEVRNAGTGCFALDSVLIGRDTLQPFADAGPDRELTCDISLVTLNGGGSTFGQNIVYEWTTEDMTCIEAGQNSVDPFVSCPGIYVLTVIDTLNGCFDTAHTEVILEDVLPEIPPINDTTLNCRDTLIELNAALIDTVGFSFRWCELDQDNNPIQPCLEDSLVIMVDAPGTYQFELTNNATGCSSVEIVNVDQNISVPTVDAGIGDIFNCTEDSLQLSGSAGPDLSLLQIEWSSASGFPIANSNTLTPTIYAPDTYTLTVTDTLSYCANSDEVIVLQDINTPDVEAGTDALLTCSIDRVMLQGSGNTTSGQIEYLWTTIDGHFISGETSSTPIVDEVGMYYLQVTDPVSNCTNIDSVYVDGNFAPPEINIDNFGNLNQTCTATIVTIDATASTSANNADLQFIWSINPVGNIIGTSNDSSLIQVDEIGIYQLILVDEENGCRDTAQVSVGSDMEDPEILFTIPQDLSCNRSVIELDASASTNGLEFSNEWIGPDGVILQDTSLNPMVELPGFYTLTITNTISGCSHTDSVEVGVDFVYPSAQIETPDELDCSISSVQLDGSNSTAGQEISYNWLAMPGQITAGQGTAIAETDTAGLYTLVVLNTSNGCADTTMVEVFENGDQVEAATVFTTSPDCVGDINGTLEVQSVMGGTAPYAYALDSGFFRTSPMFNSLPAGTYTLSIEDVNGCTFETEVSIPEPDQITVDLGLDINIRLGDSTELEALVNIPDYAYLRWSPEELFECPDCPVQVVKPETTTTYSVEVRDSNNCKAVDYITVSIAKPRSVYVPTAFSPDGDGINDEFMIYAGDNVASIRSFMIFDRWGNLVHSKENFPPNDPNFGWDGNFEGKPMNPAVFVYLIEVEFTDGWTEKIAGDLTLIR